MHLDHLRALLVDNYGQGIERIGTSPMTFEWDVSSSCENPVPVEQHATPDTHGPKRQYEWAPGLPGPLRLIIHVKCRQCPSCLRARASMWRFRAQSETAASYRTWFGSYTYSPNEHFLAMCKASERLQPQGLDFQGLSEKEQFLARDKVMYRDIQTFLKRVRKNSGQRIRYLIVTEAHKSGLPHYHSLIHEVLQDGAVRYRTLNNAWTRGFSSHTLVKETDNAAYLTKYLSKSLTARVRASKDYGRAAARLPPGGQ